MHEDGGTVSTNTCLQPFPPNSSSTERECRCTYLGMSTFHPCSFVLNFTTHTHTPAGVNGWESDRQLVHGLLIQWLIIFQEVYSRLVFAGNPLSVSPGTRCINSESQRRDLWVGACGVGGWMSLDLAILQKTGGGGCNTFIFKWTSDCTMCLIYETLQ